MSKSLTVANVLEKNRLSSDTPYLIFLDIEVVNPATGVVVETLHVVRNDAAVILEGTAYEAANFTLDLKSAAGEQPQISLSINDLTQALQSRMQEYGGGVGFNVTVKIAHTSALDDPPDIIEYFQVIGASAADYVCTFTLGAENALTRTFPRRRQTRDFCQWRYKDPDTCTYAGGLPTCDLTLQGPNGCAVHNNTLNFGAYPGINRNGVRYG